MDQLALTFQALTGRGVGFGLSGSFGQQAQGFLGQAGQRLFDMTEILFGVLLDDSQAPLHVLAPGVQLGIGEVGSSDLGGGGRAGLGRRLRENLVAQTLTLLFGSLAV